MIGLKIAEGREAEVYAWNGDAAAVLKLYRQGYLGHIAESAALTRLGGDGVAPKLIGAVEIDGRHGLLLERRDGLDMLAMLERQPWRLLEYARTLADAQIRIHSMQAPADLPDTRQTLATRIDACTVRRWLRRGAPLTPAVAAPTRRRVRRPRRPGRAQHPSAWPSPPSLAKRSPSSPPPWQSGGPGHGLRSPA